VKVRLLLDGGKPKVPPEELRRVVEDAGMKAGEGGADFGVVVGGDGRFSRYGRTEDIPLLFVGMRAKGAAGSKAQLARIEYDHLSRALKRIGSGDYSIDEYPRLAVLLNGRNIGEVFTDVYLQRGGESTCIRYMVKAGWPGNAIEESAIGDGVVVSTSAGSTGYYSYPDRIRGDYIDPGGFASIEKDEIGICHITPTYTERAGTDLHPLRYTVPWGSKISLSLFRKADARIYGTTDNRAGVRVSLGDEVEVRPGKKKTKVISL
jgi:NAD+ kinase